MSLSRILLASAALALFVLLLAGPPFAARQIEERLSEDAEEALAALEHEGLFVSADGRDLTLEGNVLTAEARAGAESVVAALPGLHRLENRITVGRAREGSAPPSPTPRRPDDRDREIPEAREPTNEAASTAAESPAPEPAAAEPQVSPLPTASEPTASEPTVTEPQASESDSTEPAVPETATRSADPAPPAPVRAEPERTAPSPSLSAEAQAAQRAINRVLSRRVIEFQVSSDRLTPGGRTTLDALIEPLSRLSGTAVEISGHTDGRGDAAANLELSARRARTVLEYLVENGIARKRLEAVGRGETQPIAGNDTPQGRRSNRRIEIRLLEAKDR